ncbi:hypothetical protein CRG98_001342 [Punica granatum]|uniref:Uncharacterized protein n=1 Tax=Punica granatum TaxID=22663 RepID=A0A2I0LC77_PUNGR|nr:hypothetical protein CRG98_001342 [Punica granatum]
MPCFLCFGDQLPCKLLLRLTPRQGLIHDHFSITSILCFFSIFTGCSSQTGHQRSRCSSLGDIQDSPEFHGMSCYPSSSSLSSLLLVAILFELTRAQPLLPHSSSNCGSSTFPTSHCGGCCRYPNSLVLLLITIKLVLASVCCFDVVGQHITSLSREELEDLRVASRHGLGESESVESESRNRSSRFTGPLDERDHTSHGTGPHSEPVITVRLTEM